MVKQEQRDGLIFWIPGSSLFLGLEAARSAGAGLELPHPR
ncbi:hypothetical protein ACVW0B_002317 [Thermostichus sp. MS-CIW-23]|jgi:hypothetical protein